MRATSSQISGTQWALKSWRCAISPSRHGASMASTPASHAAHIEPVAQRTNAKLDHASTSPEKTSPAWWRVTASTPKAPSGSRGIAMPSMCSEPVNVPVAG